MLTILLAIIGSWGAIYIDAQQGLTEFFPLTYVTITLLFSGVLLPFIFTLILAITQFVALTTIIFQNPPLLQLNWPSFLSYVLITSIISSSANYIVFLQLKQFKESSIRDHLTELLNRRYFEATLEDKIQRGLSKEYTYGIMLMDVDNFKQYNDEYNHATGDTILQRVGSFLLETLDVQSVVCRYGGDEFAIIVPNTNQVALYNVAERLRVAAKQLSVADICDGGETLSLSIGLAIFPKDGKTVEALMAHADRSLLRAKEQGKDRVIVL